MSSWADQWRKDFPALRSRRKGAAGYLDSACLSLVPRPVLDAMEGYYADTPGCGGRSVHRWSTAVTEAVEGAREEFGRYFGADPAHLVTLRNTTEAINLVGRGLGLRKGDRVLVTDQEHNSNLVIWQVLARTLGIRLDVLPLPEDRAFDLDTYRRNLARPTRLVSVFHSSNLDGRTLPARELIEIAHDAGAEVLLDGSQYAPHERLDLTQLGVDYYALSLHKMLGPSGTGLLYGAPGKLERLAPLVVGGETVAWTDYRDHEPLPVPARFEAGLQNYAGIVGARAAVQYLGKVDMDELRDHMVRLQRIAADTLSSEGVRPLGLPDPRARGSIFSFILEGVDAHDVALFLDEGYDTLVRSGMNCVHSWYRARGLDGSVRASFYLYTTEDEVRRFRDGVAELARLTQGRRKASPPTRAGPQRKRVRAR